MAAVIDAIPGSPTANSYLTADEANAYFESRLPLNPPWDPANVNIPALAISATRVLNAMVQGHRRLVREKGEAPYYVVGRRWTGVPTTTTQALPWPMTGMRDSLNREIPVMEIPSELKNATAEMMGQLKSADRTLDNEVVLQGISSVRAGSVSVSFKESIEARVLPEMVISLMPPSWFTDEIVEGAYKASWEIL